MIIKPITSNPPSAVVAQDPRQSWGFSFLSEELIAKIFSLLIDPEDQKCLKLTCQAFSRISKDDWVQEERRINHLFTSFDFRNALTALASHICSPGATIDSIKNSAKLFHRSFKASTLVNMDWSDKTNAQSAQKILRNACIRSNELLSLSCSELDTLFSRDKFRKVVEDNDINIFNPERIFKNAKLIQKAHSELPLETIEKELFQEAVAHFNEKISERTKQELEALVIKLLKEPGHSAIVLELMENTFNPYVNTSRQNAHHGNDEINIMHSVLCICFYRNLLKDKRILEAAFLKEEITRRIQTFGAAVTNQFSDILSPNTPCLKPFNNRLKLLRLIFPEVTLAFAKATLSSFIWLHYSFVTDSHLRVAKGDLSIAKLDPVSFRASVASQLNEKKQQKLRDLVIVCLKKNFPSCNGQVAQAEQIVKAHSVVGSEHLYFNLSCRLEQINSILLQINTLQIDKDTIEKETKKKLQELEDSVTLLQQIIPHEELP